MENTNINVSNIMKIARVFAILTVIIAHTRNSNYYFIGIITERLGAIGVPVFLFIAGYYFNVRSNGGIKFFWRKKITTIFIPWVFTGSFLFFEGHLKSGFSNFHILDLINWLLGNGTFLWYLPVLILCYFLLSFVKRKLYLITFIIINVISLIMTSFGLLDQLGEILKVNVNNYLNVFNWIGYFSLGVLAKGRIEGFLYLLKTKVLYIVPIYIALISVGFFIEPNSGGYFSKLAIPMQLAGMILIFALSTMDLFNKTALYHLSELTFSIYLTHFMVFPIRRFLLENPVFEFLNPIIIMIFDAGLLIVIWKVSSLFKMDKLYTTLLGIRDRKNKVSGQKNAA